MPKTNSPGRKPAWVEVDLDAIRDNAREISRYAGGRPMIAVVKEDGYGHGGKQVARALEGLAEGFGVATVSQGESLRRGGIRSPVLVMCPVPPADWPGIFRNSLTPCLTSDADLGRARIGPGRRMEGHLKFDTGIGRVGFHYRTARSVAARLARRGVREVAGAFTHLSQVFEKKFTKLQLDRFDACLRVLSQARIAVRQVHAANSGAVYLSERALAYGTLRPGLLLYGCPPSGGVPFPLRPALSFKTRIAEVRRVPRGTTVSYGHTYATKRAGLLAALPVGYSAGLGRKMSNRGCVLVKGRRAPVRGRVCMNLTVIEPPKSARVRVGDEVVLIGRQGREAISASEVAGWLGTISYEVICVVGGLNERIYRSGGARAG